MIPKKIYRLLGYNNLSIILEQERRHWLMKTDKNKQIQDSLTGDIFQGTLDNLGSDIVIESKKLPYKYNFKSDIKFGLENADRILDIYSSVFPHSAEVNGLMFARITSTNYPYQQTPTDSSLRKNHYKIKFTNAIECIIPFGASTVSSEVYAGRWIKTTTPPTLMILDDVSGDYTIEKPLVFDENVTNVVWYYPLEESLQPFDVDFDGVSTYTLEAVNNNEYIGYPLFWFTCDQTNIGSSVIITNNTNLRNEKLFFASNQGNSTPFHAKIYTCVDGSIDQEGHTDATPDGSTSNNFIIRCNSNTTGAFNNSSSDFNKDLNRTIKLISVSEQTEYSIELQCSNEDTITMSEHPSWTYIDDSTYEIPMDYFDQNCLNGFKNPLISIFDIHFDETIPFINSTTDVGLAGVRMCSANPTSDTNERYPLNLNKWSGLPEWLTNLEDGLVPEHLAVYAFHQPPSYKEDDPESMQGAGLLFDPGKHKTSNEDVANTIGRVYVLSNDGIGYSNNAIVEDPKPARTAARICDIPTSVAQLLDIKGVLEFPIVDNKYVRTQANYSEEDKNRLYNALASRWVRPVALNKNGIPVCELYPNHTSKFAFDIEYLADDKQHNLLNDVDMLHHNDFRELTNLNPRIDVSKINIYRITESGENYNVNDTGICVVGGYSFAYIVTSINDSNGAVTGLTLSTDSRVEDEKINLSNLNMGEQPSNITEAYGTSSVTGEGTGLKFKFIIDKDYYDEAVSIKKGEFFNDLFALVNEKDGLYQYDFVIDNSSVGTPKSGKWTKGICISKYERSSYYKPEGGLSVKDSFMNFHIPSLRYLPISLKENGKERTNLKTFQTGSFVNIVDDEHTPVEKTNIIDIDRIVDMCKFYCDGLFILTAETKSAFGVVAKIKDDKTLYRYNSYVIWRWLDPDDPDNKRFQVGVIYRSFNNIFSTIDNSLLPENKLYCDNFVDTNPNTTIVWNVSNVGMMVWMYDPKYNIKEEYLIDEATSDLHVERLELSYNDVDFKDGSNTKIIDDEGKYTFNVLTNNPVATVSTEQSEYIYRQPDLFSLEHVRVGLNASETPPEEKLIGNWRLVLPRINGFRLEKDGTNTQWIPKKMQLIKGHIGEEIGKITDSNGNNVSEKMIVVNESSSGISLKMFNSINGEWEKI